MQKTLLRRLERLEAPSETNDDQVLVVRLVYVDGDGTQTQGPVYYLRRNRPLKLHSYRRMEEPAFDQGRSQ